MAAQGQQRAIPIEQVPLEHLQQARLELEETQLELQANTSRIYNEVESIGRSINITRGLISRYQNTKEALNLATAPEAKGQKIMIPFTQSLYVPGEVTDVNTVLVDIGTGYYVEKSVAAADDFYQRKIEILEGKLKQFMELYAQKRGGLEMMTQYINQKLLMQAQQRRQAAAAAEGDSSSQ